MVPDLTNAQREVLEDVKFWQGRYSIAWRKPRTEWLAQHGLVEFHEIFVRITEKGENILKREQLRKNRKPSRRDR